jgi:hypothetical protein
VMVGFGSSQLGHLSMELEKLAGRLRGLESRCASLYYTVIFLSSSFWVFIFGIRKVELLLSIANYLFQAFDRAGIVQ